MSFELSGKHKQLATHGRWAGAAFLVEAMLLLVFVMASLAVLTQMFAVASEHAGKSRALTDAVTAVSVSAERFVAEPSAAPELSSGEGVFVTCKVVPEVREGGTL